MSAERFAADPVAIGLIRRLYADVGGIFCNTRRDAASTCSVCTGPTTATNDPPLCSQCRAAYATYGRSIADLVVPLAYAKGYMPSRHQSAHHLRAYKTSPPAPGCAQDLQRMAAAATYLHGPCVEATVGAWQAVTFVPSTASPLGSSPIAAIARRVHSVYASTAKVGLELGPAATAPRSSGPRPDRFVLPEEYRPQVAGQHVLVVEDTWVSGDKAQSAALTLKGAGASRVTVLCVARWLNYEWLDHRELIKTLTEPYDPARCPVTGAHCPAG